MRVYLDKCCYNRPFDDQNQARIHFETEAIATFFDLYKFQGWTLISSEVIDLETDDDSNVERQEAVRLYSDSAQEYIYVDERIGGRAAELENLGFKARDALHVACAEGAHATVLLTTDDQLLKKANKHKALLRVQVENPITWIERGLQI